MSDPSDENVVILANFIGDDGDTSYTDELGGAFTFTGNTHLEDSVTKFSNTTLYVDGVGDKATWGAAADCRFLHNQTTDWTLEGWAYKPSRAGTEYLITSRGTNCGILLAVDELGIIWFSIYRHAGEMATCTSDENVITDNTFFYFKVTYNNTTKEVELWVDGALVATDTSTTITGTLTSNYALTFGTAAHSTFRQGPCYFGPVRLSTELLSDSDVPTGIFLLEPVGGVIMLVPYPLQNERLIGFNDFSAVVSGFSRPGVTIVRSQYYMEISGSPILTIPISSWQATKQLNRTQYLQCVVPAVDDYVSDIAARQGVSNFTIYRTATLPSGFVHNVKVAESILESAAFSEGGRNYSCTLSGYPDGVSAPTIPLTYELAGVRYITENSTGTYTVRCAVDWLLRPGDLVTAGDISFTADYINYFANDQDSYMDVGSR